MRERAPFATRAPGENIHAGAGKRVAVWIAFGVYSSRFVRESSLSGLWMFSLMRIIFDHSHGKYTIPMFTWSLMQLDALDMISRLNIKYQPPPPVKSIYYIQLNRSTNKKSRYRTLNANITSQKNTICVTEKTERSL